MSLDPRFLKGVEHFNRRAFYDAHEIWEDVWNDNQGDENRFVQGLIQYATSLHHFEAKNLKGARILYDGGMELMKPFAGRVFWGVDVSRLNDAMTACLKEVAGLAYADLPGRYDPKKENFPVTIDDKLIPTISLEPSHG